MRLNRHSSNGLVVISPLTLAVLFALPMGAQANDGGIGLGGSPGLLKGHPSVAMTSELIRIVVGDRSLTADCSFVFTNRGKACSVRMGFPDQGFGASDPDEETDPAISLKSPPQTTFDSFRSYVDGREVATKLIRANVEGQYWHTKKVKFAANSIRRIRDVYTQAIGGGITQIGGKTAYASQIGYIVHTGASWHGKIGRTEIVVVFQSKAIRGTLQPHPLVHVANSSDSRDEKSLLATNAVLWKGPSAPTVRGKTLRFVRRNWVPKDDDDMELSYGYGHVASQREPTADELRVEVRNSQAHEAAIKANIENRYASYSRAFAHRDFAVIGSILGSVYTWAPLDGEVVRKPQYLKLLAEHRAIGTVNFQIQEVQFHVDKVVVTVRQTFSEPTPKDDNPKEFFQNVYSYTLRDTWFPSPTGWLLKSTEMLR